MLIALLAVFQLFFMADSTVALADRTAQANQLARRYLEQELSRPYDELQSSEGWQQIHHGIRRGHSMSTEFAYQVQVEQPNPSRNIKKVGITVSWSENPRRTVTMTSSKGELW